MVFTARAKMSAAAEDDMMRTVDGTVERTFGKHRVGKSGYQSTGCRLLVTIMLPVR